MVEMYEEGWLGADRQYYGTAEEAARSLEAARSFHWAIPTKREDGSSPRKLRVFLCHATEDKPAIRKIYAKLHSDGIDPWLDEEKLIGGIKWDIEIHKAISDTDAFVVFLSKTSVAKTGYVNREIKKALETADRQPEGKIFIIPVRIDPVSRPERFNDIHHIDYFEPDGYKRLLVSLAFLAAWLNQNGNIVELVSQSVAP